MMLENTSDFLIDGVQSLPVLLMNIICLPEVTSNKA